MYQEFRQKMWLFPIFSIKDIAALYPDFDAKNLIYWQKKGYVQKIRNRYYRFTEDPLRESIIFRIANKIYEPSYLSLESALGFYQVIPEGVYAYTSVTSLKTNKFDTELGCFTYKHISPKLFFGYHLLGEKNSIYKMASLEKCVLDYLYLHTELTSIDDFDGLRWNPDVLKTMDETKFRSSLEVFHSKALMYRVEILNNWLNKF